jgi:hypothetical protein
MASKKRSARVLFESGLGFAKFVDRLPGEFAMRLVPQVAPVQSNDLFGLVTMPSRGMPPSVNALISKYLSQRAIPQPMPVQRTMPGYLQQAYLQPWPPSNTSDQPSPGMPPNVNVLTLKDLLQRAYPYSWLAQRTMPNFPSNASAQPSSRIPQEVMSAREADLSRVLALAYGLPRFPIGTDASAQYASAGMASAWLPSSSNQFLSSMRYTPDLLRALANYGMPIAPALAASVSGSTPNTLNTAAEASRRSIGILPSLQTLTGLTKSEQEMLRGYIEGVGGLPWADTVDFIAKMTSNLQSPQRARSGG